MVDYGSGFLFGLAIFLGVMASILVLNIIIVIINWVYLKLTGDDETHTPKHKE